MALALTVFAITYAMIAMERFPRQVVALLGATVLIILNIFPTQEALSFVDWETMGLLFGMFTLVALLAEAGFFTWLASEVAHRLNYRPSYIFLAFPLLAAFMSAFMDSITVMLFLSALTIRIARLIKIDPVPLIVAEVCAANTGGASTLVGDPPNVILGTILGFTFNDFVIHSGPPAMLGSIAIAIIFYFMNRRMLKTAEMSIDLAELAELDRTGLITNHRLLRLGLAGFGVAIFLLVTHHGLSHALGLTISTATAALLPALVVMIVGGEDTKHILSKIDIESLLFFSGLFVIVGALEKTHFMEMLANTILNIAQGNQLGLLLMLHWGAGFTSAIVDNVPMALAMAYVLKDMATLPGSPALGIMVWFLATGIDIGGNLTPVGASANVVAYTYMERHHERIGWIRWIKMAALPTLAAMLICTLFLSYKYFIGWY